MRVKLHGNRCPCSCIWTYRYIQSFFSMMRKRCWTGIMPQLARKLHMQAQTIIPSWNTNLRQKYIHYDKGVAGIRMEGGFRCPAAAHRVPPPVPDLTTAKENGYWSIHTPDTLPEQYCDVADREADDDFCPIAQMNKRIKDWWCPSLHGRERRWHHILWCQSDLD